MPTPNGPKNQPRYDINDEPAFADHLTEVSDFAASVGNWKIGTTAQRNALTGNDVWDGLQFYETNTKLTWQYQTNKWVQVSGDSGWQPLPNFSGNYTMSNGAGYRYAYGMVQFRGQINAKSGNVGGSDGFFTMPAGLRIGHAQAVYGLPAGAGQVFRFRMLPTGRFEGFQTGDIATPYITIDQITPYTPSQ